MNRSVECAFEKSELCLIKLITWGGNGAGFAPSVINRLNIAVFVVINSNTNSKFANKTKE